MKKVYRGWIPKNHDEYRARILCKDGIYPPLFWDFDNVVYTSRGKKDEWPEECWPLKRVTITVEVEE